MTLVDRFRARAAEHPERIAIVDGKGRSITYGGLLRRIDELAADWADIRVGDRVVLAMPLGIDLFASLAALWHRGATVVLPEPAMGLAGLRHAVRATFPKAYLSQGAVFWALRYLLSELRGVGTHLTVPDRVEGSWPIHGAETTEHTPALISFTTGSTGKPKAIVRTHGFLAAQDAALGELLSHRDGEGADLVAFPVFVLANLGAGRTSVLPCWKPGRTRGIDARAVAFLETHGVSRLLVPPGAIAPLVAQKAPHGLAAVFTGGGPVLPGHLRALEGWAPKADAWTVYGSTEAEPIAHLSRADISAADVEAMRGGRGLLAGRPVPGIDVRFEDDEILVAGDHVVRGYLDLADAARTKVLHEGRVWHRTGDAGSLDGEGRLWLRGRHGAKAGDFYPFEVEVQAREWPGVVDAALARGERGEPILALVGKEGPGDRWAARCAILGVRITRLDRIPKDRRHGSKVDQAELERLARKPCRRP